VGDEVGVLSFFYVALSFTLLIFFGHRVSLSFAGRFTEILCKYLVFHGVFALLIFFGHNVSRSFARRFTEILFCYFFLDTESHGVLHGVSRGFCFAIFFWKQSLTEFCTKVYGVRILLIYKAFASLRLCEKLILNH
jgi:hypothetical protein